MTDIDYGTLFGISEGANETEAAEPSERESVQGEKEQESAEPDGSDDRENGVELGEAEEAESGKADAGAENSWAAAKTAGEGDAGIQPPEERAKYAAARRKAEAQRDEAVLRAREEARAEAERTIDEAFKNSGLTDPYTKRPITSKAEFEEYKRRFEAEKKDKLLKKSGFSAEEFQEFVDNLPEVQNARETARRAVEEQNAARQEAAKLKIQEQLKEIGKLDPEIKTLEDLTKMENYQQFYELVKKGNSFTDAFKLANIDAITQKAVSAAVQKERNAQAGKAHLTQTQTRGQGNISVPSDVIEAYRAFNPGATEAEIQKHYAKYLKN